MKRLILVILALAFISPIIAQGAEPIELSGPAKKTKQEVSKEEKDLLSGTLEALKLAGDGKDSQKTQEATRQLDAIIKANPEYPNAYLFRALIEYVFEQQKNYQLILGDLNNAIKYHPSNKYTIQGSYPLSSIYSLRAKVYKDMGDYKQAINDLEIAVKLDTNDAIKPSGVKPDDEAKQGSWGKRDFDEIIQKSPNDYRGYIFRGLYYEFFTRFGEKTYEHAITDYKKAISLNPKSSLCYYLLGKLYYSKSSIFSLQTATQNAESHKQGIAALNKAIKLNPKYEDAYSIRASIYLASKKYQLAIIDFDKVVELDPDKGGAYFDRGLCNQNLGKYFNAVDDFRKAIESKKQVTMPNTAYVNRAENYAKLGDYGDAVKDFTKAIELLFGETSFGTINISTFRAIYPEYNDSSDDAIAKKLHAKFYPELKYEDYAEYFLKKEATGACTVLADLYNERGDAYLQWGYFKKAVTDYERAKRIWPDGADTMERWKLVTTDSDSKHYVDIKGVTYSQNGAVSFWTKIIHNTPKAEVAYSICNFEVNCSPRMINVDSFTNYALDGTVINKGGGTGWGKTVPDTIGEIWCEGWCRD